MKSQNQQNNIDSEEEESHDSDDASKEVEYLSENNCQLYFQLSIDFKQSNLQLSFPSNTLKIPIPPPKK